MKKLIILLLLSCLFSFLSCSSSDKNPIEPEYDGENGESYPIGPLRVNYSKVRSEDFYTMHTTMLLEENNYYYYNNGNLKSKSRTMIGNNESREYFYDNKNNLIKEIVSNPLEDNDTINYRYNIADQLIKKETIHSYSNQTVFDTVYYVYDSGNNLSKWYKKDPNDGYKRIIREEYEYLDGLLSKTFSYINDELIRSYEYEYYNKIKTKELVFLSNGLLEHKTIYYYKNRALKKEEGYFGSSEKITDQVQYEYNNEYELTIKKVFVPSYSSYVNHEIHYEYYK